MKSRFRTRRTAAGLLGAVLVVAAIGGLAASASGAKAAAGHPCVVATGSGDQPFVRNFNPWQSFGNVAMDFTAGGIYENLVITTAFGGGHSLQHPGQEPRLEQERQDADDHRPAECEVVRR